MGQLHLRCFKTKVFASLMAFLVPHFGIADDITSTSTPADTTVSDLNSSLVEALQSNPEILFQKSEREATSHKITQSVGAYLPSVQLRSSIGRESLKQNFYKNNLAPSGNAGRTINNTRESSVTINQKVFDGMTTPNDIERSRRELTQSTKNVEEAQILTAYNVIDKYIAVRRFERLLKLAKENVKAHKIVLAKMHILVEAGKATIGDTQNVESRLFDAEAAVSDIEGELDTAYGNFKEVVGAEPKALVIPRFNEALVPATVKDAVLKARINNKSVVVAQATKAVTESDYDKTLGSFLPSVDMQVQARRSRNTGGKSGLETDVTGQVIGSFNVLNGGRDLGRRRELRAKVTSSTFRYEKEMRRAEKESRVSYGEFLSARAQSVALRGAVKSKQSVRDIYMKQFEGGTKSFLDILDAIHEYFLAKGSLITADATGDLAAARLLASTGVLLDDFNGVNLDPANEDFKEQAQKYNNDTGADHLMQASATEKKKGSVEDKKADEKEDLKGMTANGDDKEQPVEKNRGERVSVIATPVQSVAQITPENHTIDKALASQSLSQLDQNVDRESTATTTEIPSGTTQAIAAHGYVY